MFVHQRGLQYRSLRATVCREALGPPHEAPHSLSPGWRSWADRAAQNGRARTRHVLGALPPPGARPPPPHPVPPPAGLRWTRRPGPRTPPPRAGTLGRARPAPPPRPAGARAGSRSRSRWQRRRRRGLFLLSLRPEEPREPGPCPRAGRRRRPLPSARVSAAPPRAPIFRRSSVTRRRRRRRGPEREAPGTGARRPPPPPWRLWDPVRSALGPGLGCGPGTGGRAGGRVAPGLPHRPLLTWVPAVRRGGRGSVPHGTSRRELTWALGGGDRTPAWRDEPGLEV